MIRQTLKNVVTTRIYEIIFDILIKIQKEYAGSTYSKLLTKKILVPIQTPSMVAYGDLLRDFQIRCINHQKAFFDS